MAKHTFAVIIMAFAAMVPVAAVAPVRTMYNDALARERVVRTALDSADATTAVLTDVRKVIMQYEAVVRRYPASSYSDNALWQAAVLAADAFAKFNQAADKQTATRLFQQLAASYPSSKLVAGVREYVARLQADAGAEPPRVAQTPMTAPAPRATATAGERPASSRTDRTPGAGLTLIKGIRRTVLPDAVRIVIELDGEVAFRQERIPDPWRVFVDLPGTRASALLVDQTIRFEGDADVVRQIRIGRHPNNTTRVVLDANGVSSYSVYPLYDPYRLVIDCMRPASAGPDMPGVPEKPAVVASKEPAAPPAPKTPAVLPSRPSTSTLLRAAPSNTSQHRLQLADARVAEPAASAPSIPSTGPVTPIKPAELPAAPPVKNSTGNFSIARQLGLSVSRIVIDPGHGGHDPGAQARGVVEAELVLDVALRLEKMLQKVHGVEVILTRRTDEFIALQERTAIANREGADLFLSIHANASSSAQARGVETYFLNFASNLSAAQVAARENAASGQAMGALPDIVKAIALNNKVDESRDFATAVQRAMFEHLKGPNKAIRDLGVKQAPFVVLIGAAMPSVLAEISFVTNPQEAKLLKGNAYRDRIAEALFNAIRKYQTSLKSATSVASQQ